MASLDDELRLDAEEDAREAAFIHSQLPSELKEQFTPAVILQLMDYIVEHYVESGIFDSADDEVDIDLDEVAEAISRKASADGMGDFSPSDLFFIVQADLDYQEQHATE